MKKFKLHGIVCVALLALNISAAEKSTSLSSISKKQTFSHDFYLMLGYSNSSSKIKHTEHSLSTNFTTLDHDSDIGKSSIDISLAQELFAESTISLSLIGKLSAGKGSDKGTSQSTKFSYEDKLSDKEVGAGVDINLNNFTKRGLKIQPFIGGLVSLGRSDYDLAYNTSPNSAPIELKYSITSTSLKYSTGIRVIDYKRLLLSYASVSYTRNLNSKMKNQGTRGAETFKLSNTSMARNNPITLSIGFGFVF